MSATSPAAGPTTVLNRARAVTWEKSTCRNCLGDGCCHCSGRGHFSRRVYRRALPERRREASVVLAFLAS